MPIAYIFDGEIGSGHEEAARDFFLDQFNILRALQGKSMSNQCMLLDDDEFDVYRSGFINFDFIVIIGYPLSQVVLDKIKLICGNDIYVKKFKSNRQVIRYNNQFRNIKDIPLLPKSFIPADYSGLNVEYLEPIVYSKFKLFICALSNYSCFVWDNYYRISEQYIEPLTLSSMFFQSLISHEFEIEKNFSIPPIVLKECLAVLQDGSYITAKQFYMYIRHLFDKHVKNLEEFKEG